jgi:hypothetical protein
MVFIWYNVFYDIYWLFFGRFGEEKLSSRQVFKCSYWNKVLVCNADNTRFFHIIPSL